MAWDVRGIAAYRVRPRSRAGHSGVAERAEHLDEVAEIDESVDLCREAGIPAMVAHHWGMFDFNTVDPAVLGSAIDELEGPPTVLLPAMDEALLVRASD